MRFLMLFNHLPRFQSKTLKSLWVFGGGTFQLQTRQTSPRTPTEKHHTVTLPPLSAQHPPQPQAISQCHATRFRHPSGQCGLLGYCLSLVPGRSLLRFETGLVSSLQQIHRKSLQTSEETAPNRPQAGPNLSLGGLSLPDHSERKEI